MGCRNQLSLQIATRLLKSHMKLLICFLIDCAPAPVQLLLDIIDSKWQHQPNIYYHHINPQIPARREAWIILQSLSGEFCLVQQWQYQWQWHWL
jgi:hypothetical protein